MVSLKKLLHYGFWAIALSLVTASTLPTLAQVPGTFLPSVYGDVPVSPLPSPVRTPQKLPFLHKKILQLDQDLQEAHRPYIGHIFSYSNEPLDTFDNKLATVTEGAELGFYPNRQTQVQLDFLPTIAGLSQPQMYMNQYRATIRNQPTNRLRLLGSLALVHTFHNVKPGVALIGGAGINYALSDRIRVVGGFNRDIVGDSRLSAVGINLPGSNFLVGRVKRNRFTMGTSIRLDPRTDVDFRYSLGVDIGHHMQKNPFQEFSLRVGRTLVAHEPGAHLQLLQPSFQFLATGFKYDLSNFGNVSLKPQDNIYANAASLYQAFAGLTANPIPDLSAPLPAGVGGYFSPQKFFLTQTRLDVSGRVIGRLFYKLGGSLGTQNFKNTTTSLGQTGIVGTANAALTMRIGKHITVEQGWYFLQAANNYQRNVIYNEGRYYF